MADLEKAIFDLLSSCLPLTTLVEDRISPGVSPQGKELPRLVYSVLRDTANQPLRMGAGLFSTSVRFDSWSQTPEEALAMLNATKDCLNGFHGTQSGVRIDGVIYEDRAGPFFDPEARVFRETIDFRFLHN